MLISDTRGPLYVGASKGCLKTMDSVGLCERISYPEFDDAQACLLLFAVPDVMHDFGFSDCRHF